MFFYINTASGSSEMSRRSSTTTKVFVGSLPAGTTTQELRDLFSPYGEIAECDVVNRCGFLHLEDKQLALKAIDDLHNTSFKGSRISVEKGRVKPPQRDGRGGRGGSRNGFGPMRNNRDSYRSGPYGRDGGDYDRRGPPRGGSSYGGGRGGGGGGYDRGYDRQRPMNDSYGGGSDRRSYMDDRRGGFSDDRRFDDNYNMGPGGDNRMYQDDRSMYQDQRGGAPFDRRPMMDDRKPYDDRGMSDRRGPIGERRPLLDSQGPVGLASSTGAGMHASLPPLSQGYDRRPNSDMFSRRDMAPKPMGAGTYGDPPRNSTYDGYGGTQSRGYSGPGPRRDMPPVRRF